MSSPVTAVPLPLASAAVRSFQNNGWLLVQTLDEHGVEVLQHWVDEVASWPQEEGRWLHYREMTDGGPALCRTENFVPFHPGLRDLLTNGALLDAASALLGEPAVLYKEKINYKLPGGAGYAAHQDAPAYRFVETHVSCMVAVDDATGSNGCLEVVSRHHQDLLPVNASGCIDAGAEAALTWDAVPVQAGQTLWFHSRTPHRSGPNQSPSPRRALYPTYNARREGDLRDEYYRQKLAEFAAQRGPDGRVQVSLIGDFQGRPVE